jgi:hypothetical protein
MIPGGQLMFTTDIENFPGFPEGVDGQKLMGDMRLQAERFGSPASSPTMWWRSTPPCAPSGWSPPTAENSEPMR